MSIRGRVDVYCTDLQRRKFIAVASSDERDASERPSRVEIVEFIAGEPLYKATRISDFGIFDFHSVELHQKVWTPDEVRQIWDQTLDSESDWFEDDGWGALESPEHGASDVQPRDQAESFRPGFISQSARLLARVIRKVRPATVNPSEKTYTSPASHGDDRYVDPFQQLAENDRLGDGPFTSWNLKQLLVDITVAACDAAPWGVAGWAEFNLIPTILIPIAATGSSVRFEIIGMPYYEFTVERAPDDHYDVRLVFTGNGLDETVI
jgi:hypothetical protein